MNRILIVDDDTLVLKINHRILTEAGFLVDQAENLEQAKKLLIQNHYQVVLADMNMPDADGSKVVETAKQLQPEAEVIVITGYGSIETAIACMRNGAAEFISKPCKAEQLLEVVAKTIARKELSHENIVLQKLNKMKDTFLSLVSHELRTPLTIINGYATILNNQKTGLNVLQCESIEKIAGAAKQLVNVVNSIQLITQAQADEMKLNLQPLCLGKIVADSVAEARAGLMGRKLNMVLETIGSQAQIMGDSVRLRQVIIELIQNAVQYTPDYGKITTVFNENNIFLEIVVQDTGIGISREEQTKIFEMFYEVKDVNLHSSNKRKFGGSGVGLGLALVKAVMEAHQGKIELESELGHGTSVKLRFPKYLPADVALAAEHRSAQGFATITI